MRSDRERDWVFYSGLVALVSGIYLIAEVGPRWYYIVYVVIGAFGVAGGFI